MAPAVSLGTWIDISVLELEQMTLCNIKSGLCHSRAFEIHSPQSFSVSDLSSSTSH